MSIRRVDQIVAGGGYRIIGWLAYAFEFVPALGSCISVAIAVFTASFLVAYQSVLVLDFVVAGALQDGPWFAIVRDLDRLVHGDWLRVGLTVLIIVPALLFRSLIFTSGRLGSWLAAAYVVPTPFVWQRFQDTSAQATAALSPRETMIENAMGALQSVYLLTVLPVAAALVWMILMRLIGQTRFPKSSLRERWGVVHAFPGRLIEALRRSPWADALVYLGLILLSGSGIAVFGALLSADMAPWRHATDALAARSSVAVAAAVMGGVLYSFPLVLNACLFLAVESMTVRRGRASRLRWILLIGLSLAVASSLTTARLQQGQAWLWLAGAMAIFYLGALTIPSIAGLSRALARICALASNLAVKAAHKGDDATLLLRPFSLDKASVARPIGLAQRIALVSAPKVRLEEVVAALEFRRRPVVALGNPQEPYPELGALRDYATAETWRPYVLDALGRAARIIFIVDDTEHTRWEVDQILALERLDKVVFVIADPNGAARFFRGNPELARRLGLDDAEQFAGALRRTLCLYRRGETTTSVLGAGRNAFDYTLAYNFATAA